MSGNILIRLFIVAAVFGVVFFIAKGMNASVNTSLMAAGIIAAIVFLLAIAAR